VRGLGLVSAIACVAAVLAAALLGLLRPLDDAIADSRFARLDRPPTGNLVFVEIDGPSLKQVGVWPWPRRIEAAVLDRLMAYGADDVVFDIDFSSASNPEDDRLFAEALKRAGGYAALAVFRQTASPAGGFNLPLPLFANSAGLVGVDVPVTGNGVVRFYDPSINLAGKTYSTAGVALADRPSAVTGRFGIDFGIDLDAVDRISVGDLLAGRVDPRRIAGKDVVIGASASELRDLFVVPRFGLVPGGLVHLLAAETIIQGRTLQVLGPVGIFGVLLALAGLAVLLGPRLARPLYAVASLAVAVLFEGGALALQDGAGIIVPTAAFHLALVVLFGRALVLEIIHRRREHARAAHERDSMRAILNQVVADNFDGILVIEGDSRIIAASQVAESLLGAGLVGRSAAAVLPEELAGSVGALLRHTAPTAGGKGSLAGELEITRGDNPRLIEYALTLSQIAELDGRSRRVGCLTFRDITDRRQAEERLRFLARHDPLTGAWSRATLIEELERRELERAGTTLLLLDLKRFGAVNETLGHSYGDHVLRETVNRLRAAGLEGVARLGADSFAALLPAVLDPEGISALSGTLADRLSQPVTLGDQSAIVGVSIGATTSDVSTGSPAAMLSNADVAHSAAKRIVGNSCVVFAPAMDRALARKRELELGLRHAIAGQELNLVFQPQALLTDGTIVGAEALLRWRRGDGSQISPAEFIPIAEETGLIVELGRWVLEAGCREAVGWPGEIRLAVNVSPVQFELTDMVATVEQALAVSSLAPARLDIEITEGVFMARSERIEATLNAIRALGVGVSLDDFGTGYSSLGYVGRLPIDKIKIDQSFTRRLPDDRHATTVVEAVMMLAQCADKPVVAEGVETRAQAEALRRLGCPVAQGYLFGRPMPGGAFARLLAAIPGPGAPARLTETALSPG
jgi:diguanylate cyclase (GGDEF)-like protein